ncbi:MAG: hypothetical protein FJX71_05675 [Alphaproteobacteria bacterium]|nr:hypothetical protein [Alphaproteobacteria bacterium]
MHKSLITLAMFVGTFVLTSNIIADEPKADKYKDLDRTGSNPWDPRNNAFDRDASSDQKNPEDRANSLEGEGKESSTEE